MKSAGNTTERKCILEVGGEVDACLPCGKRGATAKQRKAAAAVSQTRLEQHEDFEEHKGIVLSKLKTKAKRFNNILLA